MCTDDRIKSESFCKIYYKYLIFIYKFGRNSAHFDKETNVKKNQCEIFILPLQPHSIVRQCSQKIELRSLGFQVTIKFGVAVQ